MSYLSFAALVALVFGPFSVVFYSEAETRVGAWSFIAVGLCIAALPAVIDGAEFLSRFI